MSYFLDSFIQSLGVLRAFSSVSSGLPGSGEWSYFHVTSGGIEARMDSILPPVFRPNRVPLS